MKITQWFPRDVAPVRPGVYEVLVLGTGDRFFSKWNGRRWCLTCDGPREAAKQTRTSPGWRHGVYIGWRGLTEPA